MIRIGLVVAAALVKIAAALTRVSWSLELRVNKRARQNGHALQANPLSSLCPLCERRTPPGNNPPLRPPADAADRPPQLG